MSRRSNESRCGDAGPRGPRPRRWLRAWLVPAACVAALAGCGGDDEARKKKSDPFAAISSAPAASNEPKRAAPRWEPVARFAGTGPDAKAFTISGEAIQWRARWRCRSGRLRLAIEPPPADGKGLASSGCPRRGEGTSIQTGKQRLKVGTSGRWEVTIEQQIDTPLHEPPLPGMSDERLLARGDFYRIDKAGKGTASLYRLDGGRLALRLERFATSANTDLFVWLSEARRPKTTKEAFKAPHVQLREVKSTIGDQNYLLPRTVKAEKIRSIVMWCVPVQNAYTAASLRPVVRG